MRKIPVLSSLSPSDAHSLNVWGSELLAELDNLKQKVVVSSVPDQLDTSDGQRTFYDLSSALTLDEGALLKTHYINCTVAANIVLPTASPGKWLKLVNIGTATFTVNTTVASVPTRSRVEIEAFTDTSYVASWPTAVPVLSESGVITSVSSGFSIKDGSGHYWIISIGTDGAIVTTDNGVVPPV